MPEYNYDTWYSKDAISNIISLNNMIRQYHVTYEDKLNDQLDLKNVILLDNQSTLDLIYNKNMTSKIKK